MMKLKRVLRHLRGTSELSVTYGSGKNSENDKLEGCTLSTVEVEYVALSKAGQECVYLQDLMSSAG